MGGSVAEVLEEPPEVRHVFPGQNASVYAAPLSSSANMASAMAGSAFARNRHRMWRL